MFNVDIERAKALRDASQIFRQCFRASEYGGETEVWYTFFRAWRYLRDQLRRAVREITAKE